MLYAGDRVVENWIAEGDLQEQSSRTQEVRVLTDEEPNFVLGITQKGGFGSAAAARAKCQGSPPSDSRLIQPAHRWGAYK